MPFGQDLRADQDVGAAAWISPSMRSKLPLLRVLSRSTRRMRACGKRAGQRRFQPLRAAAEGWMSSVAAIGADGAEWARLRRNDGSADCRSARCSTMRVEQRLQPLTQSQAGHISTGA